MSNGNAPSIRELVQTPKFERFVRNTVLMLYGNCPPERVEDIRQDVIAAMIQNEHKIRVPYAWATLRIREAHRRYRRLGRLATADPSICDLAPSRYPDPADVDHLRGRLLCDLLPLRDRKLFLDRVGGHTFRELGMAEGYSLWTARRRYQAIIEFLKEEAKRI